MMLVRYAIPGDLITPLSVYLALRDAGPGLLLESADRGEVVGRYSFVLSGAGPEVRLAPPGTGWVRAARELAGDTRAEPLLDPASPVAPRRGPLPVGVGCAGYLGFEAVGASEPTLSLPARDPLGLPSVWLRRFDSAVVFDHLHQIAEIQILAPTVADAIERRERILQAIVAPARLEPVRPVSPVAEANVTRAEFERMVREAQARIRDGEVYQLVLSRRVRVTDPPPPVVAYRRMRRLNPSPYAFLMEWGDLGLVGSSPEMLVRVEDGIAETLPIAGTARRGRTDAEDRQRIEWLRGDRKELAEHHMLVDLARNDLGRVAVPGGVWVEKALHVHKTSHLLHLTSTVKAQIRPELDVIDVVAAAFPAGTVSGAPKIRACQYIAEMEGEVRGPYGGALVRLGADGSLDTALILRTILYRGEVAYLQAGAGIVQRSLPDREYVETVQKMAIAAEALGLDAAEPEALGAAS
jgi:anthranilate synthase component 1